MDITALIFNVGILFAMLIPGIILKKCRLVTDTFGKGISNLVLYVAQPLLIVSAYMNCEAKFSEIWVDLLVVFVFSIIAHVLFAAVAILAFRGKENIKRRNMLRFVTVFANAAFMGIPLIDSILGPTYAIYASIYNITFNLFLWTLGVHFCTEREEDLDGDGDVDAVDKLISAGRATRVAKSLLKVLLHPVTIASIIGVIILTTGANNFIMAEMAKKSPDVEGDPNIIINFVYDCVTMLKNLVAPLSMVVIGLRLADITLRGLFTDIRMYIFLVLRHLALPFAVLGIMKLLAIPFGFISEGAILVTIILAATPAASSATMFAEKYDCDASYVSRLVAVSTILCILTIPLVVLCV